MDKSKFTEYKIITYSEVNIVLEVTRGPTGLPVGQDLFYPLLTVTLNTLHWKYICKNLGNMLVGNLHKFGCTWLGILMF